eukprot:CAMPEP_0183719854 /NCGR_PEP_ID=MMETSP0737-20130205/12630_1 /TAXON_ID=385413 /ORGANISM="Thalassiosira miniscula, Strain CCMP1093" /LENGTH=206 /DNA_ID=CAMNT_0025949615 /DNA_START=132 /DNA_END=752 /DNA_ORIENTATION=-
MSIKLNPSETALVLIEYQNEFTTEGGLLHDAVKECMEKTNMLENSSSLMNDLRSKGVQIMHVPIAFGPGHSEIGARAGILAGIKEGKTFQKGTSAVEFHPSMAPDVSKGDMIVDGKLGLCSFFSTNLDFRLRQKGIKNVIIGGFLTNCCVESTMRTAYEHGYSVYTLKDCTAATSMEAHNGAIDSDFGLFSTVTTADEMKAAISAE